MTLLFQSILIVASLILAVLMLSESLSARENRRLHLLARTLLPAHSPRCVFQG